MYTSYTNQYLANAVNSASKEQLMIMLYDGAIRFLSQGILAIEDKAIDKRAYYINKASAIISEFAETLDYSQNTELAENLKGLYGYMLKQLMQGNLHNDASLLVEVRNLLSELRNTWMQAIEMNKQQNSEKRPSVNNTREYSPVAITM
jgi:flagellar protein FliS